MRRLSYILFVSLLFVGASFGLSSWPSNNWWCPAWTTAQPPAPGTQWPTNCVPSNQTTSSNSNEVGIDCTPAQLANGQCTFSIYKVLGIKQDTNQDPTSVWLYVQDIVLSLTFFIGTVLTIALIYAWFLFVRSGVTGDSSEQETATKGIKLAFVWLILVMSSYTIIRLVQFIVRGG